MFLRLAPVDASQPWYGQVKLTSDGLNLLENYILIFKNSVVTCKSNIFLLKTYSLSPYAILIANWSYAILIYCANSSFFLWNKGYK